MTALADTQARIEDKRLVAIIRTGDLADAIRIVDQLVDVGVTVVEFSLSGAAALPALRDAAEIRATSKPRWPQGPRSWSRRTSTRPCAGRPTASGCCTSPVR
jgi:hypothetical protein